MTKKLKNKKIKSKITKLFAKSKQKKKKEKKVKEEKRLGKDLKEMSDEEKKKFLSMDLTERMIRVEQ
jgi:predicted Zn-dependent peptidase